jgi:protocatechuate 3,4-dioxygenase beta subunit
LVRPTVESVLAFAAGQAGAVPPATVSLAMAGVGGWVAGRFKLVCLLAAAPALAALVFTAHALTPAAPDVRPHPSAAAVARVETPAARTQVVTGRVLDAAGRPVPHAAVTALVRRPWQAADRGLRDEVVARATADADGRYRLAVPADFPTWYAERRVTLLAHAAGHAPMTTEVAIRGRPASTDIRIPARAALHGQLLGPDRTVASGVHVAVVRMGRAAREVVQGEVPPPPPPGWPADVTTDEDGRFRIEGLPAGENLWLQAQDDRYALSTFPVTAGAAEPAVVTLAEPQLFTGQIVAADTGRALAGARLSVAVGTWPTPSSHYTTLATAPAAAAAAPVTELSGRADAEGRFRLRLPPGAYYHVYVYPPEDAAYLVFAWRLEWADGESNRERRFRLVPGIEVRGQVVEDDGRPIAGACVFYAAPVSRSSTPEMGNTRPFRHMTVHTGADGQFRIVVPAGQCRLEVFGPSADYRPHSFDFEPCPYCADGHLVRVMEHGFAPLNYARGDRPAPIRLKLQRGTTVSGRVVGPDGEAIRDGVIVCRTVAHPVRSPVPRPLPIRDGVFELPGCVPGRTYPVMLLDAARRLGAVAELHVPDTGEAPPTVRLTACGTAKVRLVDGVGRPLPGQRPLLNVWLGHDRSSVELDVPATRPRPAPIVASWFDTVNYGSGPSTNADGIVVLPALVPGLEYRVDFVPDGRRVYGGDPFRVAPGQEIRLPDVVWPEDDGAGAHR